MIHSFRCYFEKKKIPRNVTISQFADDIAVYVKEGSLEYCKRLLGRAIDVI